MKVRHVARAMKTERPHRGECVIAPAGCGAGSQGPWDAVQRPERTRRLPGPIRRAVAVFAGLLRLACGVAGREKVTRSGSLKTFPCFGEDGGGSRSPLVPASGRVDLPVTEFGVHRPCQLVHRDDFGVPWEAGEESMNGPVHGARTELEHSLQRAPDIVQRAHRSAFREASGESVVGAFKRATRAVSTSDVGGSGATSNLS